MGKTIVKGALREITRTWNRFLAITVLVALGVAFYVGLKAVGPDMGNTATDYFAEQNLMDYTLLSTYGFDDEDVAALAALGSVEGVMSAYSFDAMIKAGQDSRVVRVVSLPDGQTPINRLYVLRGRLPQSAGECVVDDNRSDSLPALGSTLELSTGTQEPITNYLARGAFTVVGVVNAPNYLTRERGTSKIGNGVVTGLVYVPKENFSLPAYTELYVTIHKDAMTNAFAQQYADLSRERQYAIEALSTLRASARREQIGGEAAEALTQKQQTFDDAEAEVNGRIEDAQRQIDEANRQLASGVKELAAQRKQAAQEFAAAREQLGEAERQLAQGRQEYEANQKLCQQKQAQAAQAFVQARLKIAASKDEIAKQEAKLNQAKAEMNRKGALARAAVGSQVEQGEKALAAAKAQLRAGEEELASQERALAEALKQLEDAKKQLNDGEAALLANTQKLQESEAEAAKRFAQAQAQITEQSAQISAAQKELYRSKSEADRQLSDASQQISDAREAIAGMPAAKWYILGRNKNDGFADFEDAIGRTDGLASVFPLIFFLIAALVCLTTVTRMVDEQRTQIGTLKAIGYSRPAIAFKYLFYAGSASVLGSAIGLIAGFMVLPRIFMVAYKSLYSLPRLETFFFAKDAALSSAVAIGVTVTAALCTCLRELIGAPASLMRPLPPKSGKRVLLEKVGFLWKRLSFSRKVTIRNLFRYQKRFYMTVLGVASCSALLLTGFGLRDSIATQVTDRQFGQLFLYDLSIQVISGMQDDTAEIRDVLAAADADMTKTRVQSVDVESNVYSLECALLTPMAEQEFSRFIVLRDRRKKTPISLPADGVVLTEKLAQTIGVEVGDSVTIIDGDKRMARVQVTALAENYLMHYAILSPEAYRNAFGEEPQVNQLLVRFHRDMSDEDRHALSTKLTAMPAVASLIFQSDNKKELREMLKALDYVVWVIICSATILAFTVLYTLTNVTIAERFCEIATVKVLGFFDREVSAYVFRESYILTVIGIALGMGLGILLHGIVLQKAEVDIVMYVKQILPVSYLISCSMTLAFTWIVNRLAMGKLCRISMVEALKGAE